MGPQDIDSRLVSHINWAFAILDNEYRVKVGRGEEGRKE